MEIICPKCPYKCNQFLLPGEKKCCGKCQLSNGKYHNRVCIKQHSITSSGKYITTKLKQGEYCNVCGKLCRTKAYQCSKKHKLQALRIGLPVNDYETKFLAFDRSEYKHRLKCIYCEKYDADIGVFCSLSHARAYYSTKKTRYRCSICGILSFNYQCSDNHVNDAHELQLPT